MKDTTIRSRRAVVGATALATAALALAACGDGTGPNSTARVGLGFQLARTSSAAAFTTSFDGTSAGTPFVGAAPVMTSTDAGLRITRDKDTIIVTRAELVVRDVKLKTAAAVCTDDDHVMAADKSSTGTSNSGKGSSNDAAHEDDDCPSVHIGPFLVNVPVSGADAARVGVAVPEGTYSSVRLTLHKVTSDDSADVAFLQTNPDFRGLSMRIAGTFNGAPFVYVGDVDATLDVPLTAPVAIKSGGDDVTVSIDLSTWFLRAQGGLYSPALANTPGLVRAQVQNNIRFAFRAFRDHNRDGHED
jgi:hypothetical protein